VRFDLIVNAMFRTAARDELIRVSNPWSCIASLIETCRLNDIDRQAYLTDVLTKLVNGRPQNRIDQLIPWARGRPW
jgi:hypothetical protein